MKSLFLAVSLFGLGLAHVACFSDSTSQLPGPEADAGIAKDANAKDATAAAPYVPSGFALVPFLSDAPVRKFAAADSVIDATKDYMVVFETYAGRIVVDLHEKETPITVNSFVFLTLHHFHDGVAFHRVIDDFMAQSGDPGSLGGKPSTWGTGGPGYAFGLEVTPSLNFDDVGVLGMARADKPDTNGSQFFITFGPANSLDQKYTVFGKVKEGVDVLPSIVRGEPPAEPTRIVTAHIVAK